MKHTWKHWTWWGVSLLFWELILCFHAAPGQLPGFLMIAFSLAAAGLLAALTGLPGFAGRWLGRLLPPLVLLVYIVQLVYSEIFGSYLCISFVAMGGDAVTQFRGILAAALWKLLPRLVLMAAPLVIRPFLRLRAGTLKLQAAALAVSAAALAVLGLAAGTRQVQPSIDHWAARYGLLTAEVLDIRQAVLGDDSGFVISGNQTGEYHQDACNVLDALDLDAVETAAKEAGSKDIAALNAYLKALAPTEKHEYTGYFEGCNLIVLCAESFSPYCIDPELTPTLYRLSNEGFIFNNFYCSFPNVTTNGEYGLCMGMMPDFSRMSFQLSSSNFLPFTLGRVFSENGMTALAYHNNVGSFYHRDQTHPNMGYDFRAIGMGLDMDKRNPTSDLEMMEKTMDDYIHNEPFHAYYMTYSGHAPYDQTQDMVEKNYALVESMEASEGVRCYYAANLELEKALAYLVARLEEAGIAERTVIVLTADHTPYGLSTEDYEELAGEAVHDPFWQYRSSFICWKGGMEKAIVCDSYGCTQDILPTILNLFGFDYDSRLMTGRDLLSSGEHLAVLKDGSFLARGVHYNSVTGEAVWTGAEDPARLEALKQMVSNQFRAASALLGTNYAEFAYKASGLDIVRQEHQASCFTDIEGKWYQGTVEELYLRGILSGNGDAQFMGEDPIARVEFPVILTRALQMPTVSVELPYPDIPDVRWYTDGIKISWAAGFLPPQWVEFNIDKNLTPDEALYILTKAAEYANVPDSADWASDAMDEVLRLQAENGYSSGENTLSRGAAVTLIGMLLQVTEQG